jgi:hypothetical protein
MHKLKLIILGVALICFFSEAASAQGLFKYFKWTAYTDGPEKIDHIVVDISHDRFLDVPSGINQSNYSVGAGVYGFHDHPINRKSTLSLAIGLGYGGVNYHTNGRFAYTPNSNGDLITEFLPNPPGLDIRKNKLNVNYLEVPVELRIRSMKVSMEDRPITNFRLYMGFKGGWMVNNHTKYKDGNSKIKVYNIKNILEYRYGPTFRIGFKKISINGFYSLTPLFKDGFGPEMYPISFGISWIRL